jgi:hypothetical protein
VDQAHNDYVPLEGGVRNFEGKGKGKRTVQTFQTDIRHKQIAKLAYELWERNGRPTGTAIQDWLRAEQMMGLRDSASLPFAAVSLEAKEQ